MPILQGMMLLQSELDRVRSVARSWNLRHNISKCVVMRFGTCTAGNNLSCSYSIDDKVLNFVASHRDLGLMCGTNKVIIKIELRSMVERNNSLANPPALLTTLRI